MIIRPYQSSDCQEVLSLFYNTVHAINAKDYTEEQLDAWAPDTLDEETWDQSLLKQYSLVAEDANGITGFGSIENTGYLDRLFVHKDFQGKGIATAICNQLEQNVSGKIVTHASLTAKSYFEKRGYRVIRKQHVKRQGILLVNFLMEKVR